jgi:thiamine transport system ATP-binding protein
MLKLENLTFRYRDGADLHDYVFELGVEPGLIAGLTGRSGSGKSTCLDLIAGFLQPTDGILEIDGKDVLALPPGERPVTILFQQNNLFDHLSAGDNVGLGLNPSLRLSRGEKSSVMSALDRVGLAARINDPARQLSGGERQRVALARCLVRERPVLLLDEPFSALDAETRSEMLGLVRQIVSDRNLAALMVTHDVRDCERVADRHYKLEDDRVVLIG